MCSPVERPREHPVARRGAVPRVLGDALQLSSHKLWSHKFKASKPVTTPNGLDTASTGVQKAFGDALATMRPTGCHLMSRSAPCSMSSAMASTSRCPAAGRPDGEFNAIYQDVFDKSGRGQEPTIGSSYIQVVTWHSSHGCPDAHTILTYSESANPKSRWYDDQTKLFSQRKWEAEDFCTKAVDAHTLTKMHLSGVPS